MKTMTLYKQLGSIMLSIFMILSGSVFAASSSSTNYNITRDVMSGGGGIDSSTNYKVRAAAGQSSAIGASGSSNYQAVGGFHATPAAGAPGITGIWPGTGAIGENVSVFIFGNGFDLAPGASEVYFNGVRQWLVAPISSDMLIVRITVGSHLFGPVTVKTSLGTAISTTDFGIPTAGLQITGIWPGTVTENITTSVFVFGNEFDLSPGVTEVYFNGIRQWLVAVVTGEMLIVRTTPTTALAGPVTVTTGAGSVVSSANLVVVP